MPFTRPRCRRAHRVRSGARGRRLFVQDIGLKVFDLALHLPTADLTAEAALDERGCAATMAFGWRHLPAART